MGEQARGTGQAWPRLAGAKVVSYTCTIAGNTHHRPFLWERVW